MTAAVEALIERLENAFPLPVWVPGTDHETFLYQAGAARAVELARHLAENPE